MTIREGNLHDRSSRLLNVMYVRFRNALVAYAGAAIGQGGVLTRHGPELGVACAWLCLYAFLSRISVSHDVVWQMWVGRQLLGGTDLYTEILELNPPLWYWMAVPVEQLSQLTGTSPIRAIVAAVFLMIGCALFLLAALLTKESALTRGILLFSALLALVLISLPEFAQREHLCLIGALPYAVLISRRADNESPVWYIAAATGLLAAAGFALKHYFILVPVLLECFLLWKRRRRWTPFRPETFVLGACAIGYAIVIVTITPDYLTTIIPMIRLAYEGYDAPLIAIISTFHVAVWCMTAYLLWKSRNSLSSLSIAAALTGAGFCVSYFVQHKGWEYHALPANGSLFFTVATLIPAYKWANAQRLTTAVLILTIGMPVYAAASVGAYNNPRAPFVTKLLKQAEPGKIAVMLTANPSNMWPMIDDAGLKWPSRHYMFWMLHYIHAYRKEHGALSPELATLADTVRKQTVEDFSCNPPDLILVDDFRASSSPDFDVVGFFEEDEAFKRIFSHYRAGEKAAVYTVYKKQLSWSPVRPADCSTIY